MSTTAAGDDLDLLLSLGGGGGGEGEEEERVLETPPGSPSSPSRRPRNSAANMSVFRDAVKDYLHSADPAPPTGAPLPTKPNKLNNRSGGGGGEPEVEKYSGLRVKNQLVSSLELNNRFAGIRFVRLPVIKNLLVGDTLSGCWATVGVLTEKGAPRLTSAGKNYCVWKMGCLDGSNVSVFLFNDAYVKNCSEPVGSVFSLFNSSVRKDGRNGFSLSVYSAGNIVKIGISADYGVCKGKRKDGVACNIVINRRLGAFCKYHSSKASQRFSTTRAELKGGNIRFPFRRQSEGVYMVDPQQGRSKPKKSLLKVLSVDGLKRALSKAETVTNISHSQGLRFLSHVTGDLEAEVASKASSKPSQSNSSSSGKRPSLATKMASNIVIGKKQQDNKKMKVQHVSNNTIELDIASSDEEGL